MGARVELAVPGSDATLGVIRHGHYGRPVIVFPSEAGRAEDFANNGMLGAVQDLVDAGRVSFFCVDSLDKFSWSAYDQPTEERARRHRVYHSWLEQSVLPHIAWEMGGWQSNIITVGVSLGAYHAVHLTFQRADVAPMAIGLSGNYDPTSWNGWGELGDATYFANPTAYVANMDGDHLDWIRSRVSVLLVVGEGPFEVSPTRSLPATREFAALLADKGIRHELDVWGHDSAHDWPWWQRSLLITSSVSCDVTTAARRETAWCATASDPQFHPRSRRPLMATRTDHLVGLLLGAEEDWPTAFEALARRLGVLKPPGGGEHTITTERLTIEPFNLRDKARQELVIDRLAYWYYHPREWLKKVALMDDVYLLNSPFTFQSMEKHSAYCALIRLGLHVPETRCSCPTSTRSTTRGGRTRPRATTSPSTSTRWPSRSGTRCT
jgi:esterase/lipase superfamily enzyme